MLFLSKKELVDRPVVLWSYSLFPTLVLSFLEAHNVHLLFVTTLLMSECFLMQRKFVFLPVDIELWGSSVL